MHPIAQAPRLPRERAAAGALVLAAHALLALILLVSIVHKIEKSETPTPATVMVNIASHQTKMASAAPDALPTLQVHIAPVTMNAPDIAIQPEPKPAPTPTPVTASAPPSVTPTPPPPEVAPGVFAVSISDLAMATTGGGTGSGGGAGAASGAAGTRGGGGGGYDDSAYLARVAGYIQQHLHNMTVYGGPNNAATGDIQVVVHMVWRRDGTVEKVEIYRSSKFAATDKEAVAVVLRSQPLPPFPPEIPGEHINGLIPIVFTDKRS